MLLARLGHRRESWIGAGLRWTAPLSRRKRGSATGPNPTDPSKAGTKRHLVVNARSIPLGVILSGANRQDSMVLAATLNAIPPVRSGRGRPRQRPGKPHGDKSYDHRRCHDACHRRGIQPRIARRA